MKINFWYPRVLLGLKKREKKSKEEVISVGVSDSK